MTLLTGRSHTYGPNYWTGKYPDQPSKGAGRISAAAWRWRFLLCAAMFTLSASVVAAPRVATDIAPVHSLVAMVMKDIGQPQLVIQRGASPHSYSLRPSEAAALEDAEVVFWTSSQLTPWLERALENLSGDARRVELVQTEGTVRHEFREAIEFSQPQEPAVDRHEHADHDHDHDHDHSHEGIDPHAWLDPLNAQNWITVIANTLAQTDPANAAAYRSNANEARERLSTLIAEVDTELEPVRNDAFIVFHDAYQYFEKRFELNGVGAIALSDATDPSPARIAAIRRIVEHHDVRCVFAEPQFNPALVTTVLNGTDAGTGVLDPLGSDIPEGIGFYPALLQDLSSSLADCLRDNA